MTFPSRCMRTSEHQRRYGTVGVGLREAKPGRKCYGSVLLQIVVRLKGGGKGRRFWLGLGFTPKIQRQNHNPNVMDRPFSSAEKNPREEEKTNVNQSDEQQ